MYITEEFLEKIKNGETIFYLLEIKTINKEIYLTTNDVNVYLNEKMYQSGFIVDSFSSSNTTNISSYTINLLINIQEKITLEEILSSNIILKISTNYESFVIFNGFVSQANIENNLISIEIVSKLEKLNQTIGNLFSPICRECFGNKKCKIDLNQYSSNGEIINVISNDCFVGNHQENNKTHIGYYKYGMIKFLTGKLTGITMQIKDEIENKIFLLQNTSLLNIGDKYIIYAGCDKTMATCQNKFNNIINFRGEPFINNQ